MNIISKIVKYQKQFKISIYVAVAVKIGVHAHLILLGGQFLKGNNRQYTLQNMSTDGAQTKGETEPAKPKRTTKLSFDDYLSQWNGIATTKPVPASVNPCE